MGTDIARPISCASLLAALVAGCAVGPDFDRPSVWSPTSWFGGSRPGPKVASEPVATPVDTAWWNAFHDPVLTSLIDRAAGANLDVRTATARVAQARAQRGINAAAEFPQINGNSSATRQRLSRNGASSLFSGGASAAPGTSANGLGGSQGGAFPSSSSIPAFDLFQGGLDASYELDLWGRVRRSIESADASLVASNEARRSALISTTSEVARSYLQLRNTQAQIAIARANLATARESASLTDARSRGGLSTDLDVANALAQQAATAATLPLLEQQEAQGVNAIGLLLALPPAALATELLPSRPVPPVPPTVPVGVPSELARRRPDIRQAEAQLHAATADIGVAQADFYPRITLTGSVSLQTTQVKSLFNAASGAFAFGPSLSVPIFDGARIRRTVELREAQQQEAAIQYQRVVLQAFADVDNALIAYAAEQRRRISLQNQVTQARRAFRLAQSRFRQGISDFLEVLTAQRTVLSAEQQLADSQGTVSENLVALYKALGGGWERAYPE